MIALDNVSFTLKEGECLGLIGESGSGKSTLGKLILGLENPDQGEIILNGMSFHTLKSSALRNARKEIQAVFQNPTQSLNGRLPIWKSVIEPLENYPEVIPDFLKEVRHSKRLMGSVLLELVGLNKDFLDHYPHQLSGGQIQRVAIARGIGLQPKLLVLDEPTSNLDVSTQAKILNLLKKLKKQFSISYLFISHDLSSIQYLSDRIAVLKKGRIVDLFSTSHLFELDRKTYTKQLVSTVSE